MKRFLLVALLSIFVLNQLSVAADAPKPADNSGCYFGVFREGAPSNMSILKSLEKQTGKKFTSVMWYQDWSTPFFADVCDRVVKRGAVPHIVWEPWLWSSREAIKLDNIIAGEWDDHIRTWAKDIKVWGKPIFIRWGHEFNIIDYPWSIERNGKDPKKYVAAYRHVKDIFNKEGASNAKFVWCPMRESWPMEKWNDMQLAYPGDEYVDWIGLDGYNWGTTQSWSQWQSFTELFRNVGREMWRKHPGKPIMIAEFACAVEGGDKAKWISNMTEELKKMPYFKNINWFDLKKETDWRADSSPKVFDAFKKMVNDPYYSSNGSDLAALTSIPSIVLNRKTVKAKYTQNPIVVDGTSNEWADAEPLTIDQMGQVQEGATVWRGSSDASAKISLKWDDKNLYIAADVRDNKPMMNNKKKKNIWNGDAIEMTIGLDKNAKTDREKYGVKDYQIGLGIGNGKNVEPSIWNWTTKASPEGYAISVKKSATGYFLEAMIPWSSLAGFKPSNGDALAFDCALDDADGADRQAQLVWNGDFLFYQDPGVWGRLEFVK